MLNKYLDEQLNEAYIKGFEDGVERVLSAIVDGCDSAGVNLKTMKEVLLAIMESNENEEDS